MPRLAAFQCPLFGLLVSIALIVPSVAEAAIAPPEFVYAFRQEDGGTNQIYGFQISVLTGALTPLPGFPVPSGGTGSASTSSEHLVHANGRLYVINDGDNTLSAFAVNRSTGALTTLPFSPIALGVGFWTCVAAHPSGSPVVVGRAQGGFRSYAVTATTATAASYVGTGESSFSCAFSRNGNFVYTGGSHNSKIGGYSVAQATGVLTPLPGSPFESGISVPAAYATDSAGRLFTADALNDRAHVFTTATGVPSGVSNNPFYPHVFGVHGVLHPAGFYILASRASDRVGVLQITGNGSGTTLTAVNGSPFPTGGTFSDALALTHDGLNLVVANGTSRNLTVFRVDANSGGLQLLGVQPVNTLGTTGLITGVASVPRPIAGDFNADRHADVLWRNKVTGQNMAWLMDGTIVSGGVLPAVPNTNWEVKGVGDFDSSSRADVIWRNKTSGENMVWLANGVSLAFAGFLPTIADTNWEINGVADFDANGTADVIWRHRGTGDNIAWLMNGASVALSAFLPTIADTNWKIVGAGDFDADGRADVIWRHQVTGQNIAWLMNGASVAFSAFLPTIADTNWEIKGVGDLDTDGKADVVWRVKNDGHNLAWLMNGTTVASSAFLPSIQDLNWEIKTLRDLDGDSAVDIVWRNKATGQNLAWLMNGFSTKATAFLPTVANLDWEIVPR